MLYLSNATNTVAQFQKGKRMAAAWILIIALVAFAVWVFDR